VVGESGTASLGEKGEDGEEGAVRLVGAGTRSSRVPKDWRDRFAGAYDAELRAWLAATAAGGCTGPSAWDGYAAAVVAQTCLTAPRTGAPTTVVLRYRPSLYDVE
jgi:myo-inositol 2-dehydrogenase / D-chiro-inositol 1-dehydrogenase